MLILESLGALNQTLTDGPSTDCIPTSDIHSQSQPAELDKLGCTCKLKVTIQKTQCSAPGSYIISKYLRLDQLCIESSLTASFEWCLTEVRYYCFLG